MADELAPDPTGSSQIYVTVAPMANVAPSELPYGAGLFNHSPAFSITTRV